MCKIIIIYQTACWLLTLKKNYSEKMIVDYVWSLKTDTLVNYISAFSNGKQRKNFTYHI